MATQLTSVSLSTMALRLSIVLLLGAVVVRPTVVHASIDWQWSFGGTEAGTFQTTGELSDTFGPSSFDYIPGTFDVAASTGGPVQGGYGNDPIGMSYVGVSRGAIFDPVDGSLDWNGASVASFNRSDAVAGAGWSFNADNRSDGPGRPFIYSLNVGVGSVREWTGGELGFVPFVSGRLAVAPVPEPCALVLNIIAIGVLAFTWRRRHRQGA